MPNALACECCAEECLLYTPEPTWPQLSWSVPFVHVGVSKSGLFGFLQANILWFGFFHALSNLVYPKFYHPKAIGSLSIRREKPAGPFAPVLACNSLCWKLRLVAKELLALHLTAISDANACC
jgi:hypothetical protein